MLRQRSRAYDAPKARTISASLGDRAIRSAAARSEIRNPPPKIPLPASLSSLDTLTLSPRVTDSSTPCFARYASLAAVTTSTGRSSLRTYHLTTSS